MEKKRHTAFRRDDNNQLLYSNAQRPSPSGEGAEQSEADEGLPHFVAEQSKGIQLPLPLIRHACRRATFPHGEGFIPRNDHFTG